MFKKAKLMFLYTETSLHCGSGTSLGTVDLPIQRERYTDYPVCQASGIKGAIREWFELENARNGGKNTDKIKYTFGPELTQNEQALAAAATFTDTRILLFPVRSLRGVFAYVTSPFALARLKRDCEIAGKKAEWNVPQAQGNQALGAQGSSLADAGKVVLEEYVFDFKEDPEVAKISAWLSNNALPVGAEFNFWGEKVKKDLLVLPEEVFRDFVKLSTEVQARIKIDNTTKTVATGALFYEEALSADTLLYSLVMASDPSVDSAKRPDGLKTADDVLKYLQTINGKRTQFGGDVTIGKGIVSIRFADGEVK